MERKTSGLHRRLMCPIVGTVCLLVSQSPVLAGLPANPRAASSCFAERPATSAAPAQEEIEELPGRVLEHITRGGELARLKRYDEAIEEYKAAIKEARRPVYTAYLNMGSVLFIKEDYAKAAEAYRQAIAAKPASWQGHYNLGEALYANQDYAGAEKEYRRVVELRPGAMAINARHFLGLALYKQGRIDEAIVEYQAALEQAGGKHSEAHYNLGIALLERGQSQAAEREFRLAIEQEKTSWPEAHNNLAKALVKQQRYREAADEYEAYVKLAPAGTDTQKLQEYIDYLRRKK